MLYSHSIRITLPFDQCKHVVEKWADRSAQCVVYQHDADGKVSKTHIHMVLVDCEVKAEQLKRMWKECPGKGNEFWSWKEIHGDDQQIYAECDKFITYMSKGKLRAIFTKNISQDKLERLRQLWVEPVKADKPGSESEHKIRKIVSMIDFKSFMRNEDDILFHSDGIMVRLMDHVRSVTFKQLWGEHRIAPHASHYKIIATSVFLRLCEDNGYLSEGIDHVKTLWY